MNKIVLILLLTLSTFLQANDLPSFTLTSLAGKTISINQLNISRTETGLEFKEFKGKAILLTLWGYRCPPCLKEISEFIKLTEKHKNDLEIVAIESQRYPTEDLKAFAKLHKMNYNVIAGIDHGEFVNYLATMAGYSRGVPLPLLIAINKKGQVEQVRVGMIREDELEMLIEDLND